MKKMIILLLFVLVIILAGFGGVIVVYANQPQTAQMQPLPTVQATAQVTPPTSQNLSALQGTVISQGSSDKPEVALTIDDGPNPQYTPQVLNTLQQYNVHATFFCVGENIEAYPDLVKQEIADGNVVGNHTWSHADLTQASADYMHMQINDTTNLLQHLTGSRPVFFREPYGAINDTVQNAVTREGLISTLWSIDTEDWQLPGVSTIVNNALSQAANGSIILMHDAGGDRSETMQALPLIIQGLQQKGFQLVTLQQMANDMNVTPAPVKVTPTAPTNLPPLLNNLQGNVDSTVRGTIA